MRKRNKADQGQHSKPNIAGSQSQQVKSMTLPSKLYVSKIHAQRRHLLTGRKVCVYGVQDTAGVTASQEENIRAFPRRQVLRETYRRGVSDGIEKCFLWPNHRVSHSCLKSFWENSAALGIRAERSKRNAASLRP